MITAAFLLSVVPLSDGLTHGPYLGHIDHESAYVWVRAAEACELTLEATSAEGGLVKRAAGEAIRSHMAI